MKKLLSMLLALTLLLSLSVPAFAEAGTAEESELGGLLEKALPVVRDKVDTTETATVRFYKDLPNVPYIGVNDEGGSIDNGCPVDAELLGDGENPTTGFYDLAALSELMNEFFGESLDQAA